MTVEPAREGTLLLRHGASELPLVEVVAYNEELRDERGDGFLGDRASRRAFQEILDDWRARLRELGEEDPLGAAPTDTIPKKELDRTLRAGDPLAAGLVHSAIEAFSAELAHVTARLLDLPRWRGTERIVVGGGLRGSRVGEIAIGRAAVLLKAEGRSVDLVPIRHVPDEAGLLGSVHLAPYWILEGSDAILAVDVGGTKLRAGIVELKLGKDHAPSTCKVTASDVWRHRDEDEAPTRDATIAKLIEALENLVRKAKKQDLTLAPLVGIACPGVIAADGTIVGGGQNLPGDWERDEFSLPARLVDAIPRIGEHETCVLMHNDAVVQGLSEAPFMRDVSHWGVLTIGTGLGNARFTNR